MDELQVKMSCTIMEGFNGIDGKEIGRIEAQTPFSYSGGKLPSSSGKKK